MDHRPALTLAIPVSGMSELPALLHTLDAIQAHLAPEAIEVLIQMNGSDPSKEPGLEGHGLPLPVVEHPTRPVGRREPDGGIYDAMNRLLHHARGHRVLFLGAGDLVLTGLAEAIPHWRNDQRLEMGGVLLPSAERGVPSRYRPTWNARLLWRNTVHHQGMAAPTDLLRGLGGFPDDCHVLGDYAMNLRLWKHKAEAHWASDTPWCSVAPGGASRQFNRSLYAEELRMKQRELPDGWARWVLPVWLAAKWSYKALVQRTG